MTPADSCLSTEFHVPLERMNFQSEQGVDLQESEMKRIPVAGKTKYYK